MAPEREQGVEISGLHIPESPVYGPGVHEPRGEPDHGGLRGGHYRLIPIVTISRGQVRVRFTVGREKQYPVKDLTAFAKAMETMSLVQYGKGLAFHHSLQAFDEESRALALLIMERVGFLGNNTAETAGFPWKRNRR